MRGGRAEEWLALRRWAVVGASDDPARYGHKILRVLIDAGFDATPIHPTLPEVLGVPCLARVSEMAPPPDVVNMVVNPRAGLKVFEEIAQRGIKRAWMQPGTMSDAIGDFAAAHGIELVEDCVLIRLAGRFSNQ